LLREPLEAIWLERQIEGREWDRKLGIGPFPTWQDMEYDANVFVSLARARKLEWPPSIAFYPGRSERWLYAPDLDKFSPHNILCFSELPVVRKYLDKYTSLLPSTQELAKHWHLVLHQRYLQRMWERFGRLVYVIDSTTFELLINTTLPKMPASELEVPRQAFYVRFPPGAFHFNVSVDPEPQPVEGAVVAFSSVEAGVKEMIVMVVGKSPHGFVDDNCIFMNFYLTPDITLDEIVEEKVLELVKVGARNVGYDSPKAIIGLLLYLMSEHPRLEPVAPEARRDLSLIKNPGKRRKVEKRQQRISKLGYIYVGGHEAETVRSVEGHGRKLDHQTWVSGHWKHQPYGPRNTLRKVIWIKPHLRGPDMYETLETKAKKVQPARLR
jgi:hypothetical protein